jgi:uncharacterized membrane protein/heat shock protein HslJ
VRNENSITDSQDSVDLGSTSTLVTEDPPGVSFKMKLWRGGIDFYARGNEPFWALDIDLGNSIKFSTPEGKTIEITSYQVNSAQDSNTVRFSGYTENNTVIVTVSEKECADTMSDEKFRYATEIEIKTKGKKEFKTYMGCGQYVPDYSLHDIWILTKVNGEGLAHDRFPQKGAPTFEFYVEEGRVSGHAGCNNINGRFFRAGKNLIQFEPFAITRMMCPDMELEEIITKSVAGKRMKYKLVDCALMLSGYDNTILEFKKVD